MLGNRGLARVYATEGGVEMKFVPSYTSRHTTFADKRVCEVVSAGYFKLIT